jgi:hypothetical protein
MSRQSCQWLGVTKTDTYLDGLVVIRYVAEVERKLFCLMMSCRWVGNAERRGGEWPFAKRTSLESQFSPIAPHGLGGVRRGCFGMSNSTSNILFVARDWDSESEAHKNDLVAPLGLYVA